MTETDATEVAVLEFFTADREAELLRRMREQLAEQAAAAHVLDLAYRAVDSPIGSLLLVGTEQGLLRVAFEREDHDAVLQTLADRLSSRILRAPRRLEGAASQLAEYFAGRRTTFDLALDMSLARGFRREILTHLQRIGYGRTATYAALAVSAGNPRAVRAVGSACARNPLPVVVPCHRVVRSDGQIGEYLGGSPAKRQLLALESGSRESGLANPGSSEPVTT